MKDVRAGFMRAFLMFALLVSFQWARFWCETVGHKRMKRTLRSMVVQTDANVHTFYCPRCGVETARKVYARKAAK